MENLPIEVIKSILQQLPEKDLVKCTTVCKLFNEIITNYKLIKTLVIQNSCDSTSSVNRSYSKVIIKENNEECISTALKAIGDKVHEIKFELHSSTLNSIATTLSLLPNVQKVTFYYIHIEDEEDVSNITQTSFKGIDLRMQESSPQIFKVLGSAKVNKLEIILYGDSRYYDFENLMPFMEKQEDLESFSLGGLFEVNLMYGFIPKGPYRLKEFSIRNSGLDEWEGLEAFLMDHVKTLEILRFKTLYSFDPSSIIKSCSNLKILELHEITANDIVDDIGTVEELSIEKPNAAVTKFPNLKKLHMEYPTADTNRLIHGSKITDLSICYGTVDGLQCENLKKLKLMNIECGLSEDFFKTHSKVENLNLAVFLLDDALLESIVSNLKNLKVLSIHGINKLTKEAFQIIKKHSKFLRILDMKTWSQRYSISDWKCLFESNNGIEIYVENFDFLK